MSVPRNVLEVEDFNTVFTSPMDRSHSLFFSETEIPSSTVKYCRGYHRGCNLVKIKLAKGSTDSAAIVMDCFS